MFHLHTVRCRNDPFLPDDASATPVMFITQHVDLPGPGVRSCRRTPDNACERRSDRRHSGLGTFQHQQMSQFLGSTYGRLYELNIDAAKYYVKPKTSFTRYFRSIARNNRIRRISLILLTYGDRFGVVRDMETVSNI